MESAAIRTAGGAVNKVLEQSLLAGVLLLLLLALSGGFVWILLMYRRDHRESVERERLDKVAAIKAMSADKAAALEQSAAETRRCYELHAKLDKTLEKHTEAISENTQSNRENIAATRELRETLRTSK